MLPTLVPDPQQPIDVQETSFSFDLLGRYACNTWDEAISNGGAPFDAVVIGAGMHGAYCAEKLYRRATERNRPFRVLILDAGTFLVPMHVQNLPRLNLNQPANPFVVPNNAADPGSHNLVWGYPWHSNQGFMGLAYCIGGRSVFWGGWSPQLTAADLAQWPAPVQAYLAANYAKTEQEIGVSAPASYLQDNLYAALAPALNAAVAPPQTVGPAPLAVQGQAPIGQLFAFDKYSSAYLLIDAIREDIGLHWTPNDNSRRQLLLVPGAPVVALHKDGAPGVQRIELRVNGQPRFLSVGRELAANCAIILAAGTIESTRLALISFPGNGMGCNLMAHLRTNLLVRVKRAVFGLPTPAQQLETAAFIVRGEVAVGGQARRYHLQLTAASSQDLNTEANLFTAIPDLDHLQDLRTAQDPNWVAIMIRGLGEMGGDQSYTDPTGPKDLTKSWMNLTTMTADQLDQFNRPRAWVNLLPSFTDGQAWAAMDQAILTLAAALSGGNAADIQYRYNNAWNAAPPALNGMPHDPVTTTHHEAGTLWMGNPGSSVTNLDGRFHDTNNVYVVGPALFPTIGSANPSLTALTFARRTAEVLVP